jgi:hypothetical protein
MKKIYILLLAISANTVFSQEVIFSENMGTPAETVAISANTFQNSAPILFSGTADVRISTPSNTYDGASGNGCIFLASTTANREFIIEGINTSNFENLVLSFGHYKGTNAGSNELTVEVSDDGAPYTPLTYTRQSGPETSVWTLITASGTIPSSSNLKIKFENPMSNVGFRIDDVKLTGTALSVKQNSISGLKIYPNPVTNGTLFIETAANAEKTVAIYDVLGKNVLNASTIENNANVGSLRSGIYMVKITEEGKTATRKLVIK